MPTPLQNSPTVNCSRYFIVGGGYTNVEAIACIFVSVNQHVKNILFIIWHVCD